MALAAGAASRHLGLPAHLLPLTLLPLLLLPIATSWRPDRRVGIVLVAVGLAGWIHADALGRAAARDCRLALADGDSIRAVGVVSGAWNRGPMVQVDEGLDAPHGPRDCRADLRVALPRDAASPPPGTRVRLRGRWERWGLGDDPDLAGAVRGAIEPIREGASATEGAILARWRESVRLRLAELFPERHALVSALVLARRDGVDPALREAFTRAGVAHLLAISGFHVGVIAVMVLGLLRSIGVRKRPAAVAGTLAVWAYVAFIGAPDAAVRAGVLLGLVGAGIVLGRPLHRGGALASAFVLFAAIDPGAVARPGFQLSFLGAAGLVYLGPVVAGGLERRLGWTRAVPVRSAVAAGVAATLATLPAVAWHFERVSLVGIPVTLAATPLVAVAIPGVLGAMAADALPLMPQGVARFVAGGADLLLAGLVELVARAGELPWATAPAHRGLLLAGAAGAVAGALALPPARGVGRDLRLTVALAGALGGAVLLAPLGSRLAAGDLEVVLLDVGQGDAVALRSPRGRWLVIDAGPPGPRDRPGLPAAVEELRRRGVERVEGLLLTHPHLDHIGGAPAVLAGFRPLFVGGPGQPSGAPAYVETLEAAAEAGARWLVLRAGDELELDGVLLRVLHPREDPAPDEDPNGASLVIHLRFGGFSALLTGDAPAEVEARVQREAGDVDALKVGHHGSRTSSSAGFLATVRPEVALVSSGRRNRYGHPHPEVMARLAAVAERVHRTDVERTVRLVARRDGSWSVHD